MEQWCLRWADDCLDRQGLKVDDQSRRLLVRAIAAAIQRASLTLARLAKGEILTGSLFSSDGSSGALISRSAQPDEIKEKVWTVPAGRMKACKEHSFPYLHPHWPSSKNA